MVKLSSFILIAATAAASLIGAAPVAPTTDNTAIAIPSSPVNETAPVELSGETEVEDPMFTDRYGACSYRWNGYNEPIVALNDHRMGVQSWGNPAYNRRVRIVNVDHPERAIVARIVDKCPSDQCAWGSLDLSPYAFKKLDKLVTGILNISRTYI
ncbi:hypothetical protein BGW39_008713 [Mortierella sp. 14UC]|nr:hypothetical protein BGW39_008713 [Mortierella sp. 14UC]